MFNLKKVWLRIKEWGYSPRQVVEIEGDDLPSRLPQRDLVLLREGGEAWSIAMICPCGCGQKVELPLIREARPRWKLSMDSRHRPTLHPSVWLRDGCQSHFFVRDGKVVWI